MPERILVLLPTWVGDTVMATPTLLALRKRFADARIAAFGGRIALDVLGGLAGVDELLEDPSRARASLFSLLRAGKVLRHGRFDLAVLLSNSFRTAMVARLGRARRRLGYDRDSRGWLLTDKLAPPRDANGKLEPVSAVDYYLALAGHLGCDTSDRTLRLAVEEFFARQATELFEQASIDPSRPVVILNPGAAYGASKLWPPESFAAVADALVERRGAQIVINAGPGERAIAQTIEERMIVAATINFSQRENSLGLLKAVVARCTLMITGDTGPRHVAAAMGIDVVSLFGPTDPRWARIDYPRERIIRLADVCQPCRQRSCPYPADSEQFHQCMRRITPDMVLAEVEHLLDSRPAEVRG